MSITSIRRDAGVGPTIVRITTTDDFATITTTGYIASQAEVIEDFNNGQFAFIDGELLAIDYADGEGIFNYDLTTDTIAAESGDIITPTQADYIVHAVDTSGTLSTGAADVKNDGNVEIFSPTTTSSFVAHPLGTNVGLLEWQGSANAGDHAITVTNASFAQPSQLTYPDPGAATANFLLDTGPANEIAYQEFVGIGDLIATSGGTWNVIRFGASDYGYQKLAGPASQIIAFDITHQIRTAASKGFKLNSIAYVFQILNANLDVHGMTLSTVNYVNNVANNVVATPISPGTITPTVQAQPYVIVVSVNSPAWSNTSRSKQVVEITVDSTSGGDYTFYGLVLQFDETIA